MNYFKLQFGCLVLVLYITVIYIKETHDSKKTSNKYFNLLLCLLPWGIFFDGFTAWTVNHLDTVPAWVNLLLHGCFFVFMELSIIAIFIYLFDFVFKIPPKSKKAWFIATPGIISILLTLVTLPQLYYVHGKTTNYSYGVPVIFTYLCILLYATGALVYIIVFRKHIISQKRFNVISFYIITMGILFIQVVFPESLVSALFSMYVILCIYINTEDPYIAKIDNYNKTMVTNFATMVENRDNSTGGHIKRTQKYVGIIIEEMKKDSRYRKILTHDYVSNVMQAAPMHDVGKISTPDYILQKPGKLTPEEYEVMKQHAAKGADIIYQMLEEVDMPEFQKTASEVARYHHEKWNGKGYPEGLAGEAIPLHARIMAVADVFDALSADRCYRAAMPLETCFQMIQAGSGEEFDPAIATVFLNSRERVEEVFNEEYR